MMALNTSDVSRKPVIILGSTACSCSRKGSSSYLAGKIGLSMLQNLFLILRPKDVVDYCYTLMMTSQTVPPIACFYSDECSDEC